MRSEHALTRFRATAIVLVTGLFAVLLAVVGGAQSASAVSYYANSRLYTDQVFYAYLEAGETLTATFRQTTATSQPVHFRVSTPDALAATCTIAASSPNNTECSFTDLSSSTTGVWKIEYDPGNETGRHTYDIQVKDAGAVVTGRIFTDVFHQYQQGASTQSLWVATREGYLYGLQLINYHGAGSSYSANGFGLVETGTCTSIYRSASGTAIAANGVPLESGVSESDHCGDRYWMFFEEPDSALPPSAASIDGTLWVRPPVIPAAASNLEFHTDGPLTRAGEITFDLAGVNGGYTIQIDSNADGDFTDPEDRIIPWGSPPGQVTVPFDGLDGRGDPIGVCQAINARVVVDRAGEMHFVLADVEQLGNAAQTQGGIRLTGLTTGITAPPPLLYWDDTDFPASSTPGEPWPGQDGTAGVDSLAVAGNGAHGWRYNWGDMRSIENWTYYQASAGADVSITPPCDPSLTIDKHAELNDTNNNGRADVGETIDYSFTVSNTGNADLDNVTVDDPRVSGLTPASVDLPVGASREFSAAPYVVTQGDIDAGFISNTAVARASDPGGDPVESEPDTEIVRTPLRTPGLSIVKNATLNDEVTDDDLAELGETISYSFTVANTGNTTLTEVSVEDPRVSGIAPASATLAPGEEQVFTAAPYTVTQADMNAGVVSNTATASGTSPTGEVEAPPSTVDVPTIPPDPHLTIRKSGELTTDADSDGVISAGDTVTYTFEVTNTGTVDLQGVTVVDPKLTGPTTPESADIGANSSQTFTASYAVTQADIDAGVLRNTATATGTYGEETVASGPATAELPTEEQDPALTIVKSGVLDDTDTNGVADVGEEIVYSFLVTNDGNTTLENVRIVDPRISGTSPSSVNLAPGASATLTAAAYTVTQADVDAGIVTNTAYARGNVPGGTDVESETDTEEFPVAAPVPAIEMAKFANLDDENGNGFADMGETIIYSFRVANVGNVTLYDIRISDEMIADLLPEPIAQLAPGLTVTIRAGEYVVTSADMTGKPLVNVATATGVPPRTSTPVESDPDDARLRTMELRMANTGSPVTGVATLGVALLGAGLLLGVAGYLTAGRRRGRHLAV